MAIYALSPNVMKSFIMYYGKDCMQRAVVGELGLFYYVLLKPTVIANNFH